MEDNRIEVSSSADTMLRVGIVAAAIIGVGGIMYLLGGAPPDSNQSVLGTAAGVDQSENSPTRTGAQRDMNSRRAEVDKALKDVDFTKNKYQIEFDTTLGKIKLDLYPDVAPEHCRNIIGLTKIGFYDGILFHRVIKNFVCQAGDPLGNGTGGPGYTIDAEFNNKPHVAGTLSMARKGGDNNSAGSQFFICLGRVPHLDKQYTVFGQTADEESLKNVLKFNSVETGAGDRPTKDIKINKARVIVTKK